ncbi:MAG: metal ABC transporter substrate-binding protein, partial [Candidatus Sumerlaeaceae bacterium]|nr:metal ABC transporter substrate-binding protein [Candidatus Sumerlaeaceae bacterium]
MVAARRLVALLWPALHAIGFLGTPTVGFSQTSSTAQKIPVVVSIAPIADWVRNVGGEGVEVTTLVPPGTSPH